MNYKHMEKMREIFFRKVQNDIVDLQKYLDYYKWLDSAMTQMLDQLMPASARYAANVRNIVESHTLERNKIQYRAPLLTEPGSPSRRGVITGDIGGNDTPLGEGGDPADPGLPEIRPAEDNPRDQGGRWIQYIDPNAEQEQEHQLSPGAEEEGRIVRRWRNYATNRLGWGICIGFLI